jgi:uncharacterized protein YukE
MSGFPVPGGDPTALEQLAERLEAAAQGTADVSGSTREITTAIRANADWTGDAADAYSDFTLNLSQGAGAAQGPLLRIATAVRDYAGSLRNAQQETQTYNVLAEALENRGDNIAMLGEGETAGQNAATVIDALQQAGNRAATEVSAAGDDLADLLGKQGPVQNWINSQPGFGEPIPEAFPGLTGDPIPPEMPGLEADPLPSEIPVLVGDPIPPELPAILGNPGGLLGPFISYESPGSDSPGDGEEPGEGGQEEEGSEEDGPGEEGPGEEGPGEEEAEPTVQQRVGEILNPSGEPVGEQGNSTNTRLVDNQEEIDTLWEEFQSEFGPGKEVGPDGQIERIDLGDGDYVQYRPFSKTGGATIDVGIQGEPISRIHIDPGPSS